MGIVAFFLLLAGLGIGMVVFWVMMMIEILTDPYKNDSDRLLWFLLVFFMPFLGTIIYHFAGRSKISVPVYEEEYV